jgi:cytochrome c oxidase subunit 2
MFGFLAFLYIFYNMDFSNGDTLVLHTPASEHGFEVDRLMNITCLICSGYYYKRFYIISFKYTLVYR